MATIYSNPTLLHIAMVWLCYPGTAADEKKMQAAFEPGDDESKHRVVSQGPHRHLHVVSLSTLVVVAVELVLWDKH